MLLAHFSIFLRLRKGKHTFVGGPSEWEKPPEENVASFYSNQSRVHFGFHGPIFHTDLVRTYVGTWKRC